MPKGRATAYSEYYKNNSNTPDGDLDDEEERRDAPRKAAIAKRIPGASVKNNDVEDKRKAAIRRRLMKMRESK